MEQRYLEILQKTSEALEYYKKEYGFESVAGYHIKVTPTSREDWFERIDWLIDNGYLCMSKGMWCDMVDGYMETYKVTEKGYKYLEEIENV